MVKAEVPRGSLRALFKRHQPQLRLGRDVHFMVHLNCLLFLHRLAQEARIKAVEAKCSAIQPDHIMEVAKTVLKKSRG
ncbi:centromere protein W [Amblyraja radiata]|uniref:centromere protein W n=1 Tax=Amblyraja radiata TaxID=386614 RepID=UPI001402743B|nr:centromere protein W [Amblyraja radiata]